MKTGLAISALCHAALLLWGLLSFAANPLEAKPTDALPVDIISDKQFSEITQGVKDGAKDKAPAPLVEKVDTKKTVEESRAKVTEKKVLDAAKADTPPPPAEQQPPAPTEAKLDKKEPPKIDPIAETLKKEEAKKKAEDKAKAKAAQQQAKPQPQFDTGKIAALLDKREAMRKASTDETLGGGGIGKADRNDNQMSNDEKTAMRNALMKCWNVPAGATNAGQLMVIIGVSFKPDGTVARPPELVGGTPSAQFGLAMKESAIRAIYACQPFKMLRAETYKEWKDMEITFDPREMFGG